jgi:hypothetical protein
MAGGGLHVGKENSEKMARWWQTPFKGLGAGPSATTRQEGIGGPGVAVGASRGGEGG